MDDLDKKFEELLSELSEDDLAELANIYAVHPSDGGGGEAVSSEAMKKCIAEEKAKGTENPAAVCMRKLAGGASSESEEQISEIREVLKLGESDDLLKAIGVLAEGKSFSESKEFTELKGTVKTLTRKLRLKEYQESTTTLIIVSGKPDELAEKLMVIEESAGKDAAEGLLKEWHGLDKVAKESQYTKAILSARSPQGSSFEAEVKKYQEVNKDADEAIATKAVMKAHPDLYNEYAKEVTGQDNGSS